MKTPCAVMLVLYALLGVRCALGQSVSGRALLTYEQNRSDVEGHSGFRQSYDLGLQGYLTTTSLVRLLFHGDDFRGTTEVGASTRNSGLRTLQPSGELAINAETFRMQMRADLYDTLSTIEGVESKAKLERSLLGMTWQPRTSTQFVLSAQRNVTSDTLSGLDVVDELAHGGASFSWRGLRVDGTERYSHSTEGSVDRQTLAHQASFDYGSSHFGGNLNLSFNGMASIANLDEKPIGEGATSVPIPVAISRALHGVDETPSDGTDHPLSSAPALIDGGLATSTGVFLGPSAPSFQNIAIDLGRIERLDQIRIVVRDPSGNPLRNGGGPVTWDVYVSEDGARWTPVIGAETNFDRTFSRYEVTFTQTFSRWFKVVNFGVNSEETLLTEVQGVYHASIEAGTARKGSDRVTTGGANVIVKPARRLTLSYNGGFNSFRHEDEGLETNESTYLEHLGSVELAVTRMVTVRGEYASRDTTSSLRSGADDSSRSYTGIVEFRPTRQLRILGEVGRQDLVLNGEAMALDVRAVRVDAAILRSLTLLVTVGQQTQTPTSGDESSVRDYIDFTGNARLTSTLRLLVLATMQNVDGGSSDPTVQLLGARRDNRASAEFIWQPGRPLTLGARLGWVSGAALSGFTHRVRAEWYPFADGTVMLGGTFDQDIDPILDRRATRTVLNPRWLINRWAAFDMNFTSVALATGPVTRRQRSLYATLTLTR